VKSLASPAAREELHTQELLSKARKITQTVSRHFSINASSSSSSSSSSIPVRPEEITQLRDFVSMFFWSKKRIKTSQPF
jgi:hypothetical protein